MPLLQYNCDQNSKELSGPISAKALHWGLSTAEFQPPPDYLILANCVYYQSSLEPLLETMLELTTQETEILACYELRCPEIEKLIERWHELIGEHFEIEFMPDELVLQVGGTRYGEEFIRLAKLRRISK